MITGFYKHLKVFQWFIGEATGEPQTASTLIAQWSSPRSSAHEFTFSRAVHTEAGGWTRPWDSGSSLEALNGLDLDQVPVSHKCCVWKIRTGPST